MSFDDHPPLLLRASTVSSLTPSPLSPVAVKDTSSSSLQFVPERLANSGYTNLLAGHHLSSLWSRRLAALEVSIHDITLNVASADGPTVEPPAVNMHGLQSRIRQREAMCMSWRADFVKKM